MTSGSRTRGSIAPRVAARGRRVKCLQTGGGPDTLGVSMGMRARGAILIAMSLTFGAGAVALAGDAKPVARAPHTSKFTEAVLRGNAKFVARDFPAAVDIYRQAIEIEPKNPYGHYLLGEAQSALG